MPSKGSFKDSERVWIMYLAVYILKISIDKTIGPWSFSTEVIKLWWWTFSAQSAKKGVRMHAHWPRNPEEELQGHVHAHAEKLTSGFQRAHAHQTPSLPVTGTYARTTISWSARMPTPENFPAQPHAQRPVDHHAHQKSRRRMGDGAHARQNSSTCHFGQVCHRFGITDLWFIGQIRPTT